MCIKKGHEIINNNFGEQSKLEELYELYEDSMYEAVETDNETLKEIIQKEKKFFDTLTEEQKEKYTEINELKNVSIGITDERIFLYAFRLATRLIIECIS